MVKQKLLINQEIDNCSTTIDPRFWQKFERALKKPNFYDNKIEKGKEILSLSQMPTIFLSNFINLPKIYNALLVDIKQVLHSRDSVICFADISLNDVINTTTYLTNAYEHQATNSHMGFLVLHGVGRNNGQISFFFERVLCIRGGFSRSGANI